MKKLLLITFLIGTLIPKGYGEGNYDLAENDVRIEMYMEGGIKTVEEGKSYGVTISVKNHGTVKSEFADIKIYLANKYPLNTNTDPLLKDIGMRPLDPGRSNSGGISITIPPGFSTGTSLLFGVLEHKGKINTKIITLSVRFLPRPDLTVRLNIWNHRDYEFDGYIVPLHELMVAEAIIENKGNGPYHHRHGNYASFEIWKSTDNILDFNSDQKLTYIRNYSGPDEDIEAGGRFRSEIFLFSLGGMAIGKTYYLFAVVDRENNVAELNEDNNVSGSYKVLVIEPPVPTSKTISKTTNIYPNPTDGLIKFSNNQEESRTYSLTDLSGRVVKEGEINSYEKLELNIQNQASGLYYLKIKSENKEIELHKIVKN
jgi:hypothetical protein